jgi:hypothetical protein
MRGWYWEDFEARHPRTVRLGVYTTLWEPLICFEGIVLRGLSVVQEGKRLALAALGHLQEPSSEEARIALIHNPAEGQGKVSLLGHAALAASRLQSRRPKIGAFLAMLVQQGALLK